MSWIMVGTAAVSVVAGAYSSNQQKKAGEKAAGAAAQGSANEIAERQRQYDLTRADQKPWMDAGAGALTQMQALNSGDFSSFKASPDYQFTFDQSMKGLDRGAAARGGLYSGGHTADTLAHAGGLASQQYGTFYSRLSDLATGGNATAGSLGSLGASMGNQNAMSMGNATNARMSSYGNTADANSQMVTGTLGALNNGFQQWNAQRNGGGATYAPPSNQYASNFGNNTGWLNGGAG